MTEDPTVLIEAEQFAGGMMGEVVGLAASLCAQRQCSPRDVYTAHLAEFKELMSRGVGSGREQS